MVIVSVLNFPFPTSVLLIDVFLGTIRLWQTTPGKTYGLWQGTSMNGQ